MTRRRLAGEPVTRILGKRHFWSLELKVTPDVLDPRADSETLVEAVLRQVGDRRKAPLQILDLGTGSGALLLSLLAECPNACGIGVDVSPAACEVARHNALVHGLEERAEIRSGHWTEGLDRRFDVVVSNPPYIPSGELRSLDRAVRDHDPALALDGGPDGLDAYRSIIARAPDVLAPGGILALELGIHQAASVGALAAQGGLTVIDLRRDLAGIERAMVLVRDRRPQHEGTPSYTGENS
jgi:release factor glutamine methyltransferase